VVPLHRRERVADDAPFVFGDEHERIRILELRPEKRGVVIRRSGARGQEAPGIEVVMLLYEKRAEPAEAREVRVRRTADDGRGQRRYFWLPATSTANTCVGPNMFERNTIQRPSGVKVTF